jgi:hypothetical protein
MADIGIVVAVRRRSPIERATALMRQLGLAAGSASDATDRLSASYARLHISLDRRRRNRARRRLARSLVARGASPTDAAWYARTEWPR